MCIRDSYEPPHTLGELFKLVDLPKAIELKLESSDKGTTIAVELPAGAENDSPGADIP